MTSACNVYISNGEATGVCRNNEIPTGVALLSCRCATRLSVFMCARHRLKSFTVPLRCVAPVSGTLSLFSPCAVPSCIGIRAVRNLLPRHCAVPLLCSTFRRFCPLYRAVPALVSSRLKSFCRAVCTVLPLYLAFRRICPLYRAIPALVSFRLKSFAVLFVLRRLCIRCSAGFAFMTCRAASTRAI